MPANALSNGLANDMSHGSYQGGSLSGYTPPGDILPLQCKTLLGTEGLSPNLTLRSRLPPCLTER